MQARFLKPPTKPTHLWLDFSDPKLCHQLPDDARRLAFAPVQSSEPFRQRKLLFVGVRWLHLKMRRFGRASSLFSGESGYAPETNIAPENGWLEDEFCFGKTCFQVQAVCFREGSFGGCT